MIHCGISGIRYNKISLSLIPAKRKNYKSDEVFSSSSTNQDSNVQFSTTITNLETNYIDDNNNKARSSPTNISLFTHTNGKVSAINKNMNAIMSKVLLPGHKNYDNHNINIELIIMIIVVISRLS